MQRTLDDEERRRARERRLMAEEQQHVRTMQRLEKLPVPGRGDLTDVFHNSQKDSSQEPWGPAHWGLSVKVMCLCAADTKGLLCA